MFSRLWSFVLRLVDAVKQLVAIYQQALKLVLRLTFNLILLTDNKAFQAAIQQVIIEILSRKESKWLLDGIKKGLADGVLGEQSGEKSCADDSAESATECR